MSLGSSLTTSSIASMSVVVSKIFNKTGILMRSLIKYKYFTNNYRNAMSLFSILLFMFTFMCFFRYIKRVVKKGLERLVQSLQSNVLKQQERLIQCLVL